MSAAIIAIGGIGGSGTRLFSQIVRSLGYFIGDDLNEASDNLFFTLLFRRKNLLLEEPEVIDRSFDLLIKSLRQDQAFTPAEAAFIKSLAAHDRHNFSAAFFAERVDRALRFEPASRRPLIAWKEPNTHVFAPQLLNHRTDAKYVHVLRDGLDMAFSGNQHQLLLWGDCFLNHPVQRTADHALHFWNAAHERILALKARHPERVLILSFERVCQRKEKDLQRFLDFTGAASDVAGSAMIEGLIKPPASVGRSHEKPVDQLNAEALSTYYRLMETLRAEQ